MQGKKEKASIQLQSFAEMLDFPVQPEAMPTSPGASLTIPISISVLDGFPNHEQHFPLYTGARLEDMVSSIARFGVQTPILVWKTADGRHIIVSGHNRVNAAKLAGLTEVPAVIRTDLNEDDAEDLFFEMNFKQRSLSDMLFSQRVLCVAAHYNMSKRQGRRTDLFPPEHDSAGAPTSPDGQKKLHTDAKVAEEYELTRDKVSKFCRYATLYRPLLLMMDQEKRLGQLAAYEISFIEDQCLQELLYQILNESKPPLSKAKAVQLRREFEKGTLDADRLRHLMENQPPSRAADTISVSVKLSPAYRQYFPEGTPAKQIEATVQKALELYFRSLPQTS